MVSFLEDKHTIVFVLMYDSREIANGAICSKIILRQKDAVSRLRIVQVKLCGRGELCSSRRDSDTSKPRKMDHTTKHRELHQKSQDQLFSYNLCFVGFFFCFWFLQQLSIRFEQIWSNNKKYLIPYTIHHTYTHFVYIHLLKLLKVNN